jgi:hypothetical protein
VCIVQWDRQLDTERDVATRDKKRKRRRKEGDGEGEGREREGAWK